MAKNSTKSSKNSIREAVSFDLGEYAKFKKMMEEQRQAVLGMIGTGDKSRSDNLKYLEERFLLKSNSRIGAFYNAMFGGDDFPGWVSISLERTSPEYRADLVKIIPEVFDVAIEKWIVELEKVWPNGRPVGPDKKPAELPTKFGEVFRLTLNLTINKFGWEDSPAASGDDIEEIWSC